MLFCSSRHRTVIIAVQDDYELEENDADLMDQSTPYHWRMRAHALGHGAFHGLKVLTSQAHHLMMPVAMQPHLLPTHHDRSLVLFTWVRQGPVTEDSAPLPLATERSMA